ncbi:MAG: hypothetical protein A3G41_07810 [Elusimicrobia bacterium RIFCSPLOWO2_12_FULL_59_9]|nr:MAG: hypothetical protein A3G41_07810 [Elusimicrobia bacterium RIFCSPLOWO2_12_FULL_59_9]
MSRPSRNTDRKLLEAARVLVRESGLSGLKIREVARRARVNLGMFHYHFGSKKTFVRRLLQEIYEEFFAHLSLETSGDGSALKRLENALLVIGRFARQNRPIFFLLIREAMHGHRPPIEFAAQNVHRHLAIILSLLEKCWSQGLLRRVPPPLAVSFLLGGMGVPNLLVSLLETAGAQRPMGMSLIQLEAALLSDEAIKLRAKLLLGALRK